MNFYLNTTISTVTEIQGKPEAYELPVGVNILKSVLLLCFLAIGFIGNSLLCIIITRCNELRTRTNIFYVNLAIANIGVAVICIPFTLSTLFNGKWTLGLDLCRINGIVNSFWISACSFSLTATTIHKYLSVVKPLKRMLTKKRVYVMLLLVWLVSGLVSLLPTLQAEQIVYKPVSGQCGYKTAKHQYEAYYLLTLACAVFIFPTLINVVSYLLIFRALRRHRQRVRRSTIIDASGIRAQRKTIITLYAVFIVFIVTWLPFDLYSLFFILGKEALLPDWFLSFVYICAYSTCAQVPVIILYRSVRLRQELKSITNILCCHLKCCMQCLPLNITARRKSANISSEDMNMDRRCSAWYIAGHRPVLQLTEDIVKGTKTSGDTVSVRKLISIETYL